MNLVEWIETHQKDFTYLGESIWEDAEVGYQEMRSNS